jgi:hypothetical protein
LADDARQRPVHSSQKAFDTIICTRTISKPDYIIDFKDGLELTSYSRRRCRTGSRTIIERRNGGLRSRVVYSDRITIGIEAVVVAEGLEPPTSRM